AMATSNKGPLRAGEFAFPAHVSLRETLAVLRTARPVQHRLTIPEGLTASQIAALVNGAEAMTGEVAAPSEGAVLPETYFYEYGASRSAILARAQAAMKRVVEQAWARRAPGLPLASPSEALILASIVERETARPEERPLVAAVFFNRLRLGMRLQSDPTAIYAASGGKGTLDHPLTRAELDQDSPFNTYRSKGLPPGPICSPGLASLEAVLHPAASDALYFVADGSGGHAFARTMEEHVRNVAHWRSLEPANPEGHRKGVP
ncbi:MAG: endolytic transglycosylase MltG, partial [Acetobacteraceae bacterium]|nr:endolytic transglycosylase MltG [Acetobacteraceae bacterium]